MPQKDKEAKRLYDKERNQRPEIKARRLQQSRDYAQKNKEKAHEQWKARRDRDPEGYREARKWAQRKHSFGITREQYEEKWRNQEGLCAICRGCFDDLDVDHCHQTGMVRGLICSDCNTMLGFSKDRTSTLQNAIAYLEYHHNNEG